MRSTNSNSVETINAAATAIVSAETRVQPTTVTKRRWGSCWNLNCCFGSHKNSKRISHAVLVPEPVVPGVAAPANENPAPSTAVVLPFIAPPSSPASFLQSDPPSATQSPAGLLPLTSLSVNTYSPGGPASSFAIGPYAYETQSVSPPVFSTFTTEPSTAPFTPPPESMHLTTPSSPEVPFAQLLTSSLDRTRRNSGTNLKFALSHYEFQPYQQYPGSPGGHLISPGSVISNSGTSTPFPDRRTILEFRMGEAPKILGFEYFSTRKWGSRLGSGSLTPDGVGLGSMLGSGSLTPNGMGLGSRLNSGSLTPEGAGQGSRLGSGSLTPDAMGLASRENCLLENQISEMASLINSGNGCQNNGTVMNHRVSFELTGEDVARCLANKPVAFIRNISEASRDIVAEAPTDREGIITDTKNCSELSIGETSNEMPEKSSEEGEEQSYRKHRSISLGSTKEFNFDNSEREVSDKPAIGSEWWANEKVMEKEARPGNNLAFFPMLQPGVS
ncbi:uncharacterized protein LOC121254874 isoform X1 [Juglans microcarpa x Juglans regia]|uniref:uncharacterized protein LOC121254874 isoform X1 n=1 Tax=Juglans microcarpa x Juglans regia TaxID=2249226 RepID=UPI001B7DE91D|nr:uncharacterized protein LOC121254874 isoform X1 [Juglans microcarpa x Juglans regia]